MHFIDYKEYVMDKSLITELDLCEKKHLRVDEL